MKELDFDINKSPFSNFFTSRFSISARIDAKFAWDYACENDLSFFILSLGCLLKGLNSVPELRRRIIDGKAIEFDSLDGVTPIMNKNEENWTEMRVSLPTKNESLKEWHDNVIAIRDSILNGEKSGFSIPMAERDREPIANFSCIPWIDFDTVVTCIEEPHQIQPLVSWGKISEDGKMSVAISANHIFVNGKELGKFYDNISKCFNNIESICGD